jgi:DNA-directed RNA polymerase alpha subunit
METLNIEIVNPKAKILLLNLAEMNLINIKSKRNKRNNKIVPYAAISEKTVTFDSISVDTTGFKFNRDEANER